MRKESPSLNILKRQRGTININVCAEKPEKRNKVSHAYSIRNASGPKSKSFLHKLRAVFTQRLSEKRNKNHSI